MPSSPIAPPENAPHPAAAAEQGAEATEAATAARCLLAATAAEQGAGELAQTSAATARLWPLLPLMGF